MILHTVISQVIKINTHSIDQDVNYKLVLPVLTPIKLNKLIQL